MVANKTAKYDKIIENEESLAAFFDGEPNLGQLLGLYRYSKT